MTISSSNREIEASNRWWAKDNVAQHILLSRLGPVPRGLIPAANIVTRTALSIYNILLKRYGTSNYADCTELLSSLHNSICTPGRIQDFVSKWRTGLSTLHSAHFVFSIKICVAIFVRGLPPVPAFNTLRADLPRRIAAIADDHDFAAFVDLTDTVLELDTIFRPSTQSQVNRPPRAPPTSVPQRLLFLLYLQLFLNPLHALRRKNLLVTTASPEVYVLLVTLTEHVFRRGGYGRSSGGIFE